MLEWIYVRWDALGVDNFLKHMDHVVELSVYVTDDDNRLLNSNHVRFVTCKRRRKQIKGLDKLIRLWNESGTYGRRL